MVTSCFRLLGWDSLAEQGVDAYCIGGRHERKSAGMSGVYETSYFRLTRLIDLSIFDN
jgi:hypothetical protein